jgi:hypothetical protein
MDTLKIKNMKLKIQRYAQKWEVVHTYILQHAKMVLSV